MARTDEPEETRTRAALARNHPRALVRQAGTGRQQGRPCRLLRRQPGPRHGLAWRQRESRYQGSAGRTGTIAGPSSAPATARPRRRGSAATGRRVWIARRAWGGREMKAPVAICATLALLAACVADTMRSYVGQDIRAVMLAYGPPANEI